MLRTVRDKALSEIFYRRAQEGDAEGIASVLQDIFEAGKRKVPVTTESVLGHYITHPDSVRCTVAVDQSGQILGFQSLRYAAKDNPYDVAVGWGIIGTHIRPSAARRGIGRGLFAQTLNAARNFGLTSIDATIGADNQDGLAYYDAMGFRTYRQLDAGVSKAYALLV